MVENDKDKLGTLISYLIDHNKEHAAELRELGEQLKGVAGETTQDYVNTAADLMDKSTASLSLALADLKPQD